MLIHRAAHEKLIDLPEVLDDKRFVSFVAEFVIASVTF